MSKRRVAASHVEWLSLVETTGTFLTVPVVRRVFPNGLDRTHDDLRAEARRRLTDEPVVDQASATAWLDWVLSDLLGFTPDVLLEGPAVPPGAAHLVPEHGLLRPEYAIADPAASGESRPLRMLVLRFPFGTKPDQPIPNDRWAATPIARAQALVKGTGVPLAMATDGDWFAVAATPSGGGATSALWPSALFAEEPILLDSFHALLSARRFFAVEPKNTLPELLAESVQAQEEVTNQLGDQVRRAVELLVAALSRADRAHEGRLLHDVTAEDVYAASLTCMMRLVFLLYAEERDLLPARQELYATSYGVLPLRQQLQEQADRDGDDALERRSSAWHRLLATFRVVHGGVDHEGLRLPGYGGGLFDPERYPFLEGRRPGDAWRTHASRPLPVDDRTVLAVLDALQVLTFRDAGVTEARPLSYRSLDVEQIGHVYEGLLDHGAVRVDDLAVGLRGRSSDGPEISLEVLEDAAARGRDRLISYVAERTGLSEARIGRDLARQWTTEDQGRLRAACDLDDAVVDRVRPFAPLLDVDLRGLPKVFLPGSVYVTTTTERRDTGTQYTPKDLADEIVRYALEPLVYAPGPAETADASEWRIKRPEEILDLRVCDPAVGSGAILVAACRFLAERLVEAATAHGTAGFAPNRFADEDVGLVARRLIVDHCLYGVDRNPIAAEMAKLSLWLVTLAKERPFTFLDHAIQVGDSLLGVTSIDQVRSLHLDPERGKRLHYRWLTATVFVDALVDDAGEWITAMRNVPVVSLDDAEDQRQMDRAARATLEQVSVIADAIVACALAATMDPSMTLDERLVALSATVVRAADTQRTEAERTAVWGEIHARALFDLDRGTPMGTPQRRPLHWPLAFPEVFRAGRGGFDAVVGNPPFLGGKRISGRVGDDYRAYLRRWVANDNPGSADLVAYFFLRAAALALNGCIGLLATNTIAQGDTRQVGLVQLAGTGRTIYRAESSRPWPGGASVSVSQVWMTADQWSAPCHLNQVATSGITAMLTATERADFSASPKRLRANGGRCFYGTVVGGEGFLLSPDEADWLLQREPQALDVIEPFLSGSDVNSEWDAHATRYVINFQDWALERAAEYPMCLDRVTRLVKPSRDLVKRDQYRRRWWQFAERCANLYKAIDGLERVIVMAQVSNTLAPTFVPARQVFSSMVVTFAMDDPWSLAVVGSSAHKSWVRRYTSTLQEAIRYTPTVCFEPFPWPSRNSSYDLGVALHHALRQIGMERDVGLTGIYQLVNNPKNVDSQIVEIRDMHRAIDSDIFEAYGWSDLQGGHAFRQTRRGFRFDVSEPVEDEIVRRLLSLNTALYKADAVLAGNGVSDLAGSPKRRRNKASNQLALYRDD